MPILVKLKQEQYPEGRCSACVACPLQVIVLLLCLFVLMFEKGLNKVPITNMLSATLPQIKTISN